MVFEFGYAKDMVNLQHYMASLLLFCMKVQLSMHNQNRELARMKQPLQLFLAKQEMDQLKLKIASMKGNKVN